MRTFKKIIFEFNDEELDVLQKAERLLRECSDIIPENKRLIITLDVLENLLTRGQSS